MSDKFGIMFSGKIHKLQVMNTSKEDAGEYTFICGRDRVSAALTVNRKSCPFTIKAAELQHTLKPLGQVKVRPLMLVSILVSSCYYIWLHFFQEAFMEGTLFGIRTDLKPVKTQVVETT